MRTQNNSLFVALTAVTLALTSPAQAGLVGVTSSADLGGTDNITWNQLGAVLTPLFGPQNVVSANGENVTVSSDGNVLVTLDQGPFGWNGNFAPGTRVLANATVGTGIVINFLNGITAFGTTISADVYGAFVATEEAFDKNGNLLGSFSINGISSNANDGSAPYLGIKSDLANIFSIKYSTYQPLGISNDFAIGTVEFASAMQPGVPEPSTWAMGLIGFAAIGFATMARRRRSSTWFSNQTRLAAGGARYGA